MQNKTKIILASVGLLLALTGSNANAVPITIDQSLNASVTAVSPYNGAFDLTLAGFSPGSDTLSAATASFSFLDLDRVADTVFITLNSSEIINGTSTGKGWSAFGGDVTGVAYTTLNASGKLDYTVTLSGSSAVTLKGASFIGEYTRNTPTVPDGGSTLTLLGCAILGLGWARRKLIA